eukprot:m.895417 g.895417  ORF g.895417 m.895417 type:complete len:76 (-) comp59996_c0_seq3:1399-1626(-)
MNGMSHDCIRSSLHQADVNTSLYDKQTDRSNELYKALEKQNQGHEKKKIKPPSDDNYTNYKVTLDVAGRLVAAGL